MYCMHSVIEHARTFDSILVLLIYIIIRIGWSTSVLMANLAVLCRHSISRSSSSIVDQPEVGCCRPEVENAAVGTFRGAGVVVGSRAPVARCLSDTVTTGNGNGAARTGSCFPASSSKHFRSSSTVDAITADELAARLREADGGNGNRRRPVVVVVDCRTFLSFNMNHVAGAFNASCGDRFSRRRLMQGRATIADLISGGPSTEDVGGAREAYRRLADAVDASPTGLFVAYDDNTIKLESLQESHPLRLLTTSLTGSGYRTKFLEGVPRLRLNIGVGDGEMGEGAGRHVTPTPTPKKSGKYSSGNYYVKFGYFGAKITQNSGILLIFHTYFSGKKIDISQCLDGGLPEGNGKIFAVGYRCCKETVVGLL